MHWCLGHCEDLDVRWPKPRGHLNPHCVKLRDKRVQTPGMSPPRAGAWTYCLFTLIVAETTVLLFKIEIKIDL